MNEDYRDPPRPAGKSAAEKIDDELARQHEVIDETSRKIETGVDEIVRVVRSQAEQTETRVVDETKGEVKRAVEELVKSRTDPTTSSPSSQVAAQQLIERSEKVGYGRTLDLVTDPEEYVPFATQIAEYAKESAADFGTETWYTEVLGRTDAWNYLDDSGKRAGARFMARRPDEEIKDSWIQYGLLVDEMWDGRYEVRDIATGQLTGGGTEYSLGYGINPLSGFETGSERDTDWMQQYAGYEDNDRLYLRERGVRSEISEEDATWLSGTNARLWADYRDGDVVEQPGTTIQEMVSESEQPEEILELTDEEAEKIGAVLEILDIAQQLGELEGRMLANDQEIAEIEERLSMPDEAFENGYTSSRTDLRNLRVFFMDDNNKARRVYETTMTDLTNKVIDKSNPLLNEMLVDELRAVI